MKTTESGTERKKLSLSAKIMLGLALGIVAGLFFGDMMGSLTVVAMAFIRLLQMTVLPYITVSLVTGLGQLSVADAKRLAVRGGSFLLLTWLMAFALILLAPLAFPTMESAAFFSSSLVESKESVDFLSLYIPSNPFNSMANTVVPAVVVFSFALGLGLMSVKDKAPLLGAFSVLQAALARITNFIVRLMPYGVFAIAASAAGTMSVEEFGRLQVYFVAYITMCLLATFWILPALITAITPFSYREVVGLSRDALVTGFATGNLFVILPILSENAKKLFAAKALEAGNPDQLIDVIIPISFNFPGTGKLMTLIFIPFAAWFTGVVLEPGDYPGFVGSSLASYFGSANVAMPMLLDQLHIPADMFQLYVMTGVVNARFSTLLAAMHVLFLALAGTCALTGCLRLSVRRLLRFALLTVLLVVGAIVGARTVLSSLVSDDYRGHELLTGMGFTEQYDLERVPFLDPAVLPAGSVLQEVIKRGELRFGYHPDSLPFAFVNATGETVGFNIELAHMLARDLGVELKLVQHELGKMREDLAAGKCDLATSIAGSQEIAALELSNSILDITICFMVKDHRRHDFSSVETIMSLENLKIAVPSKGYFADTLQRLLPNAQVTVIDDAKGFFEGRYGEFDAMLYAAEPGSAWTLLYPGYSVAIPHPVIARVPVSYAVRMGDRETSTFLSKWLDLKRHGGDVDRLYDHWILGVGARRVEPRWCVVRDVLGWVK